MASNLEVLKLFSVKLFRSAVESVMPDVLVRKCVKREGNNLIVLGKRFILQKNCHVVGFGKAVLSMSKELENILGEHLISGTLSVPEGIMKTFENPKKKLLKPNSILNIMEGARYNLPDANAERAAASISNMIKDLDESHILFVTISGGGSALLPSPKSPITLNDKIATIKLLSCAGANINELNNVRKSLSYLKGGGLAMLAYPAQVIALILSDIVGDPLDSIASGPTVLDAGQRQPLQILQKYSLEDKVPKAILRCLKEDSNVKSNSGDLPVSDGQFSHVFNYVIGNNSTALEKVAEIAQNDGYLPVILSSSIEGDVRDVSRLYSNLAVEVCHMMCGESTNESLLTAMENVCKTLNVSQKNHLKSKVLGIPNNCKQICLILGGETTVEVKGSGLGGRNQELALAFSLEVSKAMKNDSCCERCDIVFLSCGTDGIDGPTSYAGAVSYPQQIHLAKIKGIDPHSYLDTNNSTNFFIDLNNGEDLVSTGHTGTNVMDIHIFLIERINK